MKKYFIFCLAQFLFVYHILATGTGTAPMVPPMAGVHRIYNHIRINGILDEKEWNDCPVNSNFVQIEPAEGNPATFDSQVRILYNDQYLYFGVYCPDTLKKWEYRVPNLKRDFIVYEYDCFGIVMDAFNDRRNSVIFTVTPFGSQRDVMVLNGQHSDLDWNAAWEVMTSINDTGWIAEFAIPWSTLRYMVHEGETVFGINFYRINRRLNELSCWSPVPRSGHVSRMEFAGKLTLSSIPKPSFNLQLQPFLIYASGTSESRNAESGEYNKWNTTAIGGELKWAINTGSVLDLTVNTDFAQTELDGMITNLDRFSYYFPEKRQFFLENASAFTATFNTHYFNQPFYSRRIGLDEEGNPIPIQGGGRFVRRTEKDLLGLMLIRQKSEINQMASNFSIFRYTRNMSDNNNAGILLTYRSDQGETSMHNYSVTTDAFMRLNPFLTWSLLGSGTVTTGKDNGNGVAASSFLEMRKDWAHAWLVQTLVTKNYSPEAGFVTRKNILYNATGIRFYWRPAWKPSAIRSFGPSVYAEVYHNADDLRLTEAMYSVSPLGIYFNNGGVFSVILDMNIQKIRESFYPLGIEISPGEYKYMIYSASYQSDLSKKFSMELGSRLGSFYDGTLVGLQGRFTAAPIPNISIVANYSYTKLEGLGTSETNMDVLLLAPELRLALNPRLHLSMFYQKNTSSKQENWNARFTWEFKPMSNLYLVFSSNSREDAGQFTENNRMLGKITFLQRF